MAGEVARLLNGNTKIGERRLKPEDIAGLVMENQQARKKQEALSDLNIPSVLHTTASLFQSQQVLEFRRILAGVALPGDERLVKAALATDLFGVDGAQLSACTESQWQEWLQRFISAQPTLLTPCRFANALSTRATSNRTTEPILMYGRMRRRMRLVTVRSVTLR